MKMTEMKELAACYNVVFKKSKSTVNGKVAYEIEGKNGLFTKSYLVAYLLVEV